VRRGPVTAARIQERKRETEAGWRWGANMQTRAARFKRDLNRFRI
jgi:hypothetical protein